MKRFEIFEDNGGGVYLAILEGEQVKAVFENWEYVSDGSLWDAIDSICEDEDAWVCWDGNLAERLNVSNEEAYEMVTEWNEPVAWGDTEDGFEGIEFDQMGTAIKNALGYEKHLSFWRAIENLLNR